MRAEPFTYTTYGFVLSSDIALPGVPKGPGKADIRIRSGTVPEQLGTTATFSNGAFEASPDQFLFTVAGVGRYHVAGGREIVVQRFPGADEADVVATLLGSALTALLHQRNLLVLHGAALAVGGKAVLVTGVPGIGKSTLAAALSARGHDLITEDLCVITSDKAGRPVVAPGIPTLKLWGDALTELGKDRDSLRRIRPGSDKYDAEMGRRFRQRPAVVSRIYELSAHDTPKVTVTPITGVAKLTTLINATFRYEFLEQQGGRAWHFTQSAALASAVDAYHVARPRGGFLLGELVGVFERELASV